MRAYSFPPPPIEINHAESVTLVGRIISDSIPIYSPVLALTESASALARTTGDVTLIAATLALIETLPGLTLIDLTADRGRNAAGLATSHLLRGADSVYVQVSLEFGTALLTWDDDMLTRAPAAITTMTPSDWLISNP